MLQEQVEVVGEHIEAYGRQEVSVALSPPASQLIFAGPQDHRRLLLVERRIAFRLLKLTSRLERRTLGTVPTGHEARSGAPDVGTDRGERDMPERRRERRRERKEPTRPRQEQRKEKQTKFVIAARDLEATPEELDKIKGTLLKNAVTTLKNFKTAEGEVVRPDIGVEFFSLSFSLSFSLGIGEPEELAERAR